MAHASRLGQNCILFIQFKVWEPQKIHCMDNFICLQCQEQTLFSQEIWPCHRASAGSNKKKDTLGLGIMGGGGEVILVLGKRWEWELMDQLTSKPCLIWNFRIIGSHQDQTHKPTKLLLFCQYCSYFYALMRWKYMKSICIKGFILLNSLVNCWVTLTFSLQQGLKSYLVWKIITLRMQGVWHDG